MTFKLFKWDPAWFEQADTEHIAPDWDTELQKDLIPKPVFISLTMGCKEGMLNPDRTKTGLTEAGYSIVRTEFSKRALIISSNFPDGPSTKDGGRHSSHYVLLKDATQVVYDLGWKLPRPMLKLISPPLKRNKGRSPKGQVPLSPSLAAFGFQSDYLDEVCALIKRYFKDKEGNPITDPSKWPLKKNIESEILHGRLLDAVDTLITSGQRRGNRKE
jgi:hypothetical protein